MSHCQDAWQPTPVAQQAATHISDPNLRSHIRFLADDLLEGRGPGTRGDQLAQLYIRCELESLGIQAGAGDGTWFQQVPLVGVSTAPPTSVTFRSQDQSLTLNHHSDMMLVSGQAVSDTVEVAGDLVFVGYGIQAPEYQWDDYKGMDLSGKILVMLNNDPEDDPDLFAGRRRLYYGRWDYKYAMAARMGAAGALILHTTASAGYPYQVVQTSWSGEEFRLADTGEENTLVNGWLTEEACQRLMQLGGQDLNALIQSAQSRDFRPVPLGISTKFAITAASREQLTGNVIGVIPGSDPELRNEYVVFTAHHDHLGLAAERDASGDNIYNGAVDNASGTAALLSIAKAFASLQEPPKRSIMFAFVGAEEQGLLGSKYLAENPPIPAGYMAAVLNIDGINFLGKTFDVSIVGNGKSDLDPLVEAVASWQGRNVVPEVFPDRGYYYRSDQFSLAQVGVPGVYLDQGVHFVGRPDGWGKEQWDAWTKNIYHQPSDEYDDSWNLEGAIDDARLLMHVGWEVANQPKMPEWLPGDEFEAARQAAIASRDQE
ncbi:MAG: M20/M25/M40 family metallo-hydrolase [bacterium]|nr:M20/M25/M40 family metallo-hydrolase [bacterium]